MEFCEICDNMLYVKSNEEKKLVKFCKHCDFEKVETVNTAINISKTFYSGDDLLYNQHVNKYLRYDFFTLLTKSGTFVDLAYDLASIVLDPFMAFSSASAFFCRNSLIFLM